MLVRATEMLCNAIRYGRDNALHLEDAKALTGLTEREVRRCIEHLRLRGEVICSDKNGYYRPANVQELRVFCRQEAARARSITRRTTSARKQLKILEQIESFGGKSLLDYDGDVRDE